MFEAARQILDAYIAAGRIPGAAIGIVSPGRFKDVYINGASAWEPAKRILRRENLFDLASLSKVIFTTTEILSAYEEGLLRMDIPIGGYVGRIDLAKHAITGYTVEQLLTHQTLLPATFPLLRWGTDVTTLKAQFVDFDWPRGDSVYSDINFIALGLVLEKLRKAPLRALIGRNFCVNPGPENAVATEYCELRHRMLCGETHDENAYALGGLAGHAGLFGSIDAVLDFAERLMRGQILKPSTIAFMTSAASGTRCLGWQIKHPGWPGGEFCSVETVGHNGFTGTGLWIDFSRQTAIALLTNRVHPSRTRETGIAELRPAVCDAIWRALPHA